MPENQVDATSYPVVVARALEPVAPKRIFTRAPYGRTREEIPALASGHHRVYKVRNQEVLDTAGWALDSQSVVDAEFLWVVDGRKDIGVPVVLTIPTKDAAHFTTRVMFLCSVKDPVAVVQAGGDSAARLLAGYLRGHQRLFELGLDFDLSEVNAFRRKVSAHVRAYVTLAQPDFPGLETELAGVEVDTPPTEAGFQDTLRETRQQHQVQVTQLTGKQKREVMGTEHDQRLGAAKLEHVVGLQSRAADAVSNDPYAGLHLAYAEGTLSAKELAQNLRELREQEVAQDREDLRLSRDFEREQEKLVWRAERADLVRQAQWDREDRRLAHEEAGRQMEARLEVVRELAKHGHLDALNLHLDKFVNEMLAGGSGKAIEGGDSGGSVTTVAPSAHADSEDAADGETEDDDENSTRVES
jgi:hypothetical protein